MKLNNERHIFCHYIFNYDDKHTFDLYVSYTSFIIFFTIPKSMISCHLCHNCFKAIKKWQKVPFPILVHISIGKFNIPGTPKQRTSKSRAVAGISQFWWTISQYIFNHQIQVNCVNPLMYPVSVSDCTIPECGTLCILISDLTLKSALLLFTLLRAIQPHFKKSFVIGNCVKWF